MSKKLESTVEEAPTRSRRGKKYSDDFKRDAVRLVTEELYTFSAAAAALGVSMRSLHNWHERFAPRPKRCGEEASLDELRDENQRLRQQLKRAEMERDILKKATAYFAKESL